MVFEEFSSLVVKRVKQASCEFPGCSPIRVVIYNTNTKELISSIGGKNKEKVLDKISLEMFKYAFKNVFMESSSWVSGYKYESIENIDKLENEVPNIFDFIKNFYKLVSCMNSNMQDKIIVLLLNYQEEITTFDIIGNSEKEITDFYNSYY